MKKISVIMCFAFMLVIFPALVSAQGTAVRTISPALADRGGMIDVRISFTATENLKAVGITENVPAGWNVSDINGSESALGKFDANLSTVEFGWGNIPSGTNVFATYRLHIPNNVGYGDYGISGTLNAAKIGGDYIVIVSSKKDTQPPVIHNVTLTKTGGTVFVTVNVTDDIGVVNVTANNIQLLPQGDNWAGPINWVGNIPAQAGTNIPVVVVATDASGKSAVDSSQKYNAAGQPGATGQPGQSTASPASPPSGRSGATNGQTPAKTTPAVNASNATTVVSTTTVATATATATASTTSASNQTQAQSPGFELVFAVTGLLVAVYLIGKRA